MLLVHDANVLIDLHEGGLLGALFQAPWRVVTPNALYHRELASSHEEFLELGLELLDVEGDWVLRSVQWAQTYRQTSAIDRLCLALALQEGCPLLTGDARLTKAARDEGCTVHGTLWLVERLIDAHLTTPHKALEAYDAMERAGRRLPFAKARKRLRGL